MYPLGFITTICQAEVFDLGCTGITKRAQPAPGAGQPSHTGTVASMGHRRRGQPGNLTHQSVPIKQHREHEVIFKPRLQKQKCWASIKLWATALPIWGTHRLLHAKDPKVIPTAGALTAALLHCQPFHFGIEHHLTVSTKIIINSQKAPTTCHVQASELRSSWRTGAGSHQLWHLCTGVCAQPPLSCSSRAGGRKSPALPTTFPELLLATPHSIFSLKKWSAGFHWRMSSSSTRL